MVEHELNALPANKALVLKNTTCPYCGEALSKKTTTKEHVIGRRFVPKGKLNAEWNLVLNACLTCNNKKSDLENDISAVSLSLAVTNRLEDSDEVVRAEASRKRERSVSRRTKKFVNESEEKLNLFWDMGAGASATFSLVAPPQIDDSRAFELARLQLIGFFYFITYQKMDRKGYYWTGGFHPLTMAPYSDWGNDLLVDFALAVKTWEPRFLGHTADGYFSVCIRRSSEAECWSWAVEWNRSYRLVGFFGDRAFAEKIVASLRSPTVHRMSGNADSSILFREEKTLDGDQDFLFSWDGIRKVIV